VKWPHPFGQLCGLDKLYPVVVTPPYIIAHRRLPDTEGDKPKRSKFKTYPICYFHSDIAAAVPYHIHTVLTHNGTHFTDPTGGGWTPKDIKAVRADGVQFRCHSLRSGLCRT